jgi:hypothetical protein
VTPLHRLEATLGQPCDFGETSHGRRRIVSLTSGTFTGRRSEGSCCRAQVPTGIILSDGTALGDIRYTLQTDQGDLLYVQSRGVRHGAAEVLARLARGDDVDYGCGTPRNGKSAMRSSCGFTPWGFARPCVMKTMRLEKTSSVMTLPLG